MAHNDWYNEVLESVKVIHVYATKNYSTGLTFNFNGSSDWSDMLSGKSAPVQQQQQHSTAPAPKDQPQCKF